MPAAATLESMDNSDGFIIDEVASTVFINGKPAALIGSIDRPHAPYGHPHPPHDQAIIVEGSGTVMIEGKPAARVGDQLSCGHMIAEGSDNVNIGG